MSRILDYRDQVAEQHPTALLVFGILVIVSANLFPVAISPIIARLTGTYEIDLSIFTILIYLIVVNIIVYILVGVPVAKVTFRHPHSLLALILQAFFGLFVLPGLVVFTEIGIAILAQLAAPLTVVPIVGGIIRNISSLINSWALLFLMYATIISTMLGFLCTMVPYFIIYNIYKIHDVFVK
jgi:hypothetical protein